MPAIVTLANLTLCSAEDRLSGWVPGMNKQVQSQPLARAKNVKRWDRGNLEVTYTFTVSRGHTDYAAASAYLDDLPRACGRAFGNFTANRGMGGPDIKLVEADVTFSPRPIQGIHTWVQFTVTGALPPDVV